MPLVRYVILALCIIISAQRVFAVDQVNPFSYSNQKLFAKSLVSEKDYYRAISEIYRIKFTYSIQFDPELELMLIESYYHSNLHDKVIKNAHELLNQNQTLLEPGFRNQVATFYTGSLVENENLSKASKIWNFYCAPVKGEPFLGDLSLPEPVDPDKAKLNSALLPGSGLFASGEYGKGVVSFLLNALFIGGAFHFASEEQYGIAGLLLFFEIGWYFGGQNAAHEAAENHNRKYIYGAQKAWIEEKIDNIHPTPHPTSSGTILQAE